MDRVQRILKVLTLTTACLAVPFVLLMQLNAILSLGEPSGTPLGPLETLLLLTTYVLTAPIALVFIFLLSFNRIATGRWQYTATCIIVINALFLLTISLMAITGVIPSDPKVPVWLDLSLWSIFVAPSLLFLLNRLIGHLRAR